MYPQHLVFECTNKPFFDTIAFRSSHKNRTRHDLEKPAFGLEVIAQIHNAMIMPSPQAPQAAGRDGTELLEHILALVPFLDPQSAMCSVRLVVYYMICSTRGWDVGIPWARSRTRTVRYTFPRKGEAVSTYRIWLVRASSGVRHLRATLSSRAGQLCDGALHVIKRGMAKPNSSHARTTPYGRCAEGDVVQFIASTSG